jgi:hypothetical protein
MDVSLYSQDDHRERRETFDVCKDWNYIRKGILELKKANKLRGLSPRANYTNRAGDNGKSEANYSVLLLS